MPCKVLIEDNAWICTMKGFEEHRFPYFAHGNSKCWCGKKRYGVHKKKSNGWYSKVRYRYGFTSRGFEKEICQEAEENWLGDYPEICER